MVDPISIIALAGDVIAQCYRYGSAIASAPEEARKLVAETTSLSGVLVCIQGLANKAGPGEPDLDLSRPLSQCKHTLELISARLVAHSNTAGSPQAQRLFRRLIWPLKKTETLELLASVERQKTTLMMTMDILTGRAIAGQGSLIRDVATAVASLDDRLAMIHLSESQGRIMKWLSDYDYEAAHYRAAQLYCHDTCAWITHDPQFTAWIEGSPSMLWFHGMAGSGKSVLTSFIVEFLRANRPVGTAKDGVNLMSYFYCDANTNQSPTLETFLGSVMSQFCAHFPSIPQDVKEAYKDAEDGRGTHRSATAHQLQTMIRNAVSTTRSSFLIVDGLDEATNPVAICRFLKSLTTPEFSEIHVFVTSRPETSIREAMTNVRSMTAPISSTASDIALYIEQRMCSDFRLQRLSTPLKSLVQRTLISNASGMFRWVQCQLDEISKLRTEKAIKAALSGLPKTLEASYARLLQRIDEDDIQWARRTLLWLTNAFFPLLLHQVAEAVVIEPTLHSIDPECRLSEPADLLEICGMLVVYDELCCDVRLAHHSVRDYLSGSRASDSLFWMPRAQSHREIAELCLAYLLMDDFSNGPLGQHSLEKVLIEYPLLHYAARNWTRHVITSGSEKDLQPLILKLMTPVPNPHFFFWLQVVLSRGVHGYKHLSSEVANHPQPLYYASSYGLYETVKSLIAAGADLNAKAGQFGGTAYHAACWRQHKQIARLLLESGVDIEIRDNNGMTAFDLIEYTGFYGEGVTMNPLVDSSLRALYKQPIKRKSMKRETGPPASKVPVKYRDVHKGFTFELE